MGVPAVWEEFTRKAKEVVNVTRDQGKQNLDGFNGFHCGVVLA